MNKLSPIRPARWGMMLMLFAAVTTGSRGAELNWDPDKPDTIGFKAVKAQYVRLTLAGAGRAPCLDEVQIFGPGRTEDLALAAKGATADASSCIKGYKTHQVAHLIDGKFGNEHSWIAGEDGMAWVMVKLPAAMSIDRVVVSRDREGRYSDRTPGYIEVGVGTDGQHFTTVAEVGSAAAARDAGPADRVAEQAPKRVATTAPPPAVTDGLPVDPPLALDAIQDDGKRTAAPSMESLCNALQVVVEPVDARYLRVALPPNTAVDEVRVFAPGSRKNLAAAAAGAMVCASSHGVDPRPERTRTHVAYLNDGAYGQVWAPDGKDKTPWIEVGLPASARIDRVLINCRKAWHRRGTSPWVAEGATVYVSLDRQHWSLLGEALPVSDQAALLPAGFDPQMATAFISEESIVSVERNLDQFAAMIERFAERGLDVAAARAAYERSKTALEALDLQLALPEEALTLLCSIRQAKRDCFLRDPELAPISKLTFVKRHPYLPSHNYSDFMDGRLKGGGGLYRLDIPRENGRFVPEKGTLKCLYETPQGIARDVTPDWEAKNLWFACMPSVRGGYVVPGERNADPACPAVPDERRWHLYKHDLTTGETREMTTGPHHDYYPCVLPDGDVCFVTTRCNMRFLCWVPTTMVLYRMKPDGTDIRPISRNNLSEWGPTIIRDGRIMWTRSEYQDKGADYGHTIWAIRPDGSHPELVYGNNTPHNIMNAMQVPGKPEELLATKISHFGDFNGPMCYIDLKQGPFDSKALKVIPNCESGTSNIGIYRDPWPIATDLFLCSHLDGEHFSLYVMDRYGNRELLHRDPAIGCMTPVPLQPREKPPVLAAVPLDEGPAEMTLIDVYDGLDGAVERGRIKWLRICRELPAFLEVNESGSRRETYGGFTRYYASPYSKVASKKYGFPAYVAKEVVGLVPVEEDGSAHFTVPTDQMFYFQALDENFTEIQRMRSVIQAVPGEKRTCLGCHDDRMRTASPPKRVLAMSKPAATPTPPPWGAGPFWYERVVQPVLDRRCVSCHDGAKGTKKLNLTAKTNPEDYYAPASYATLIRGNYVSFHTVNWHAAHKKVGPLTVGSSQSRLFEVLKDKQHEKVALTADEIRAIKCWIDLNVPLWGDYQNQEERAAGKTLTVARPVGFESIKPAKENR